MSTMTRYIENQAGCWIWQGATNKATGYGTLSNDYAHRLFFEATKGEIPAGMTIDHLCKVRNCVNPDHLEAVSQRVNNCRSGNPAGLNAQKTHCLNGHEFSPENTRIITRSTGDGRMCVTCNRAYQRKLYNEAKAARA